MIRFAPKTTKPWQRTFVHFLVKLWRSVALLEDTPKRIALGSAIGMFFSWQPLVGSQMAISALFSKIFRGNVLASLPWTWLSNPFTVAPMYFACYRLGNHFFPVEKRVTIDDIRDIYGRMDELGVWGSIKDGWKLVVEIIVPLQVGCVIVGLLCAVVTYFTLVPAVRFAQKQRFLRRSHWLLKIRERREIEAALAPTQLYTAPGKSPAPVNDP